MLGWAADELSWVLHGRACVILHAGQLHACLFAAYTCNAGT